MELASCQIGSYGTFRPGRTKMPFPIFSYYSNSKPFNDSFSTPVPKVT